MSGSPCLGALAVGVCGHSVCFPCLPSLGANRNCPHCQMEGAFLRGAKNYLAEEMLQYLAKPRTVQEEENFSKILEENLLETETELAGLEDEHRRLTAVAEERRERRQLEQEEERQRLERPPLFWRLGQPRQERQERFQQDRVRDRQQEMEREVMEEELRREGQRLHEVQRRQLITQRRQDREQRQMDEQQNILNQEQPARNRRHLEEQAFREHVEYVRHRERVHEEAIRQQDEQMRRQARVLREQRRMNEREERERRFPGNFGGQQIQWNTFNQNVYPRGYEQAAPVSTAPPGRPPAHILQQYAIQPVILQQMPAFVLPNEGNPQYFPQMGGSPYQ